MNEGNSSSNLMAQRIISGADVTWAAYWAQYDLLKNHAAVFDQFKLHIDPQALDNIQAIATKQEADAESAYRHKFMELVEKLKAENPEAISGQTTYETQAGMLPQESSLSTPNVTDDKPSSSFQRVREAWVSITGFVGGLFRTSVTSQPGTSGNPPQSFVDNVNSEKDSVMEDNFSKAEMQQETEITREHAVLMNAPVITDEPKITWVHYWQGYREALNNLANENSELTDREKSFEAHRRAGLVLGIVVKNLEDNDRTIFMAHENQSPVVYQHAFMKMVIDGNLARSEKAATAERDAKNKLQLEKLLGELVEMNSKKFSAFSDEKTQHQVLSLMQKFAGSDRMIAEFGKRYLEVLDIFKQIAALKEVDPIKRTDQIAELLMANNGKNYQAIVAYTSIFAEVEAKLFTAESNPKGDPAITAQNQDKQTLKNAVVQPFQWLLKYSLHLPLIARNLPENSEDKKIVEAALGKFNELGKNANQYKRNIDPLLQQLDQVSKLERSKKISPETRNQLTRTAQRINQLMPGAEPLEDKLTSSFSDDESPEKSPRSGTPVSSQDAEESIDDEPESAEKFFTEDQIQPLVEQYQKIRITFAQGNDAGVVASMMALIKSIYISLADKGIGEAGADDFLPALIEIIQAAKLTQFDKDMIDRLSEIPEKSHEEKYYATTFRIALEYISQENKSLPLYDSQFYNLENQFRTLEASQPVNVDAIRQLQQQYLNELRNSIKANNISEMTKAHVIGSRLLNYETRRFYVTPMNHVSGARKRAMAMFANDLDMTIKQMFSVANRNNLTAGNPFKAPGFIGAVATRILNPKGRLKVFDITQIFDYMIENPKHAGAIAEAIFERKVGTRLPGQRNFRQEFAQKPGLVQALIETYNPAIIEKIRTSGLLDSSHMLSPSEDWRMFLKEVLTKAEKFIVIQRELENFETLTPKEKNQKENSTEFKEGLVIRADKFIADIHAGVRHLDEYLQDENFVKTLIKNPALIQKLLETLDKASLVQIEEAELIYKAIEHYGKSIPPIEDEAMVERLRAMEDVLRSLVEVGSVEEKALLKAIKERIAATPPVFRTEAESRGVTPARDGAKKAERDAKVNEAWQEEYGSSETREGEAFSEEMLPRVKTSVKEVKTEYQFSPESRAEYQKMKADAKQQGKKYDEMRVRVPEHKPKQVTEANSVISEALVEQGIKNLKEMKPKRSAMKKKADPKKAVRFAEETKEPQRDLESYFTEILESKRAREQADNAIEELAEVQVEKIEPTLTLEQEAAAMMEQLNTDSDAENISPNHQALDNHIKELNKINNAVLKDHIIKKFTRAAHAHLPLPEVTEVNAFVKEVNAKLRSKEGLSFKTYNDEILRDPTRNALFNLEAKKFPNNGKAAFKRPLPSVSEQTNRSDAKPHPGTK